jgi:hypothetical protein
MSRFFGRLSFVHRRLWQLDAYYRVSILLGPAALVGLALAAGLWWGGIGLIGRKVATATPSPPPGWATRRGGDQFWDNSADVPPAVKADAPLPPTDTNGLLMGFKPGWEMYTGQLEVNAVDATLLPTRFTSFSLVGSSFDMGSILAAGPKNGPLYVGVGSTFLAVKAPGIYGLSARLERPASETANCLTRLVFGGRRVVSNVDVGINDDVFKNFDTIRFTLQPGLYRILMAFGCWHNQAAVGPGSATLMIIRPGEQKLEPVPEDDLVRLEQHGSPNVPSASPPMHAPAAPGTH